MYVDQVGKPEIVHNVVTEINVNLYNRDGKQRLPDDVVEELSSLKVGAISLECCQVRC